MTDLVERLRATADWDDSPWWWDSPEKTFGHDIGSPASLIAEAAEELATLRAIVRDLAAIEPVEENDWGVRGCVLCAGYKVDARAERLGESVPADRRPHADDCVWRRAAEIASRSGKQPPVLATPGDRDRAGGNKDGGGS